MTNAKAATAAPRHDRWAATIGLAGVVLLLLFPLGHWIAPGDAISDRLIREAIWWGYAAVVVAWLLLVEHKGLASIGFRRPTWLTPVVGVIGAVASIAALVVHSAVIAPWLHLDVSQTLAVRERIMRTPYWYRVLMVLRAAVVEEILFRGYIMEKTHQLSGSWILAIALSLVSFTYAHFSGWGLEHLIPVFGAGLVFSLLYAWRRDLPANIIGHFLTDAAGFLLG